MSTDLLKNDKLVSVIFTFLLLSAALILSSALRWGRRGDFVRRAELPKPFLMSSRVYIRGTYHVTVWTLVFKDLVKHGRWVCPANMFPPLILLFLKHTRLPAHLGQLCFLHRRAHTHTLSHTPEQTCLTSELTVGQPPDTSHSSATEVKRRWLLLGLHTCDFFFCFYYWNSIFFLKPALKNGLFHCFCPTNYRLQVVFAWIYMFAIRIMLTEFAKYHITTWEVVQKLCENLVQNSCVITGMLHCTEDGSVCEATYRWSHTSATPRECSTSVTINSVIFCDDQETLFLLPNSVAILRLRKNKHIF